MRLCHVVPMSCHGVPQCDYCHQHFRRHRGRRPSGAATAVHPLPRILWPLTSARSEVALLLVTLALIEACIIVAIRLAAEGLLNSVTSTHSRRRYMLPARLLADRVRSASDLTKGARAGQCRLRHVRRATYRWVAAYTPKPYRGRPSPRRAAAYQQWRLHKLSKHIRLYRSRDVLQGR